MTENLRSRALLLSAQKTGLIHFQTNLLSSLLHCKWEELILVICLPWFHPLASSFFFFFQSTHCFVDEVSRWLWRAFSLSRPYQLWAHRAKHTEHFLHSDFHYDFASARLPYALWQKCVVFTHLSLAAYLSVWQLQEPMTHRGLCKLEIKEHWEGMKSDWLSGKTEYEPK